MATITCLDCGTRRTGPKNTKYCQVCRLLRDIEFWMTRTGRCNECDSEFAPVRRGDPFCGDCSLGSSHSRGHCALCHTNPAYRIHPDVAVCERCARDPKKRRPFILGLRRKQQETRERNAPALVGGPGPEAPPETPDVP